MAFKSPITTATRQASFGGGNYQPVKRDMLMNVTGYDLENYTIKGVLSDGRVAEVKIEPQALARGIEAEARNPSFVKNAPYLGHRIDKKMEAKIPVSKNGKPAFAVLENAYVVRKGKDDVRVMFANRVMAGGGNKNKILEALMTFTMNHKMRKVERVQVWNAQSVLLSDTAAVDAFKTVLDTTKETHVEEEAKLDQKKSSFWLPYAGFELRVVIPNVNPTMDGEVVELSGRYETTSVEELENGELVVFKHQITSAEFAEVAASFEQYAKEKYGDHAVVELTQYTSYPNGQFCKELDFNTEADNAGKYNPYKRMATAQSKIDAESSDLFEGGNFGCWGVMMLSRDERDSDGAVVAKRYYVSRVFTSTTAKNFVHQKIKGTDGRQPKFSDKLKGALMQYGGPQVPVAAQPVEAAPEAPANKPATDSWATDDDVPFNWGDVETAKPTGAVPASKAPNRRAGTYVAKKPEHFENDVPF